MSSSGSSSLPRLGPTWSQGGRGFQPPPPVPAERARARSGSAGSSGSEAKPNVNKFSVLDDDDDVVAAGNGEKRPNSRSEALRSFQRASSTGSKPAGRSLADLAARSTGHVRATSSSEGGGGRFLGVGDNSKESSTVTVIRFTRERLLSMRPPPKPDAASPPQLLEHLEGSPIIAKKPQDPVCWDTFEPDDIWATVPVERVSRSNSFSEREPPKGRIAAPRGLAEPSEEKRKPSTSTGPGGGRWQRGVALPPPEESANRGRREDAENPNELWDDPVAGGTTGAAADFSAFGAIPDDPKSEGASGGQGGIDAFDFNVMAEASRRFDMERHGSKGSDMSEDEDNNVHSVQVNPHRPLASAGTTIQSGSGDGINVFEDFDDEIPGETDESEPAVKSGAVDDSASSRLMKMIGVTNDAPKEEVSEVEASNTEQINSWGIDEKNTEVRDPKTAAIPSNPWGTVVGSDTNQQHIGLDLSSRLEAVVTEQKLREARIAAELERRRRAQEEEEAKQRALRAQREQAEAANAQQQGGAAGHSQVELVLMERISTFLENSWGRSDLVSILSTLHAEDTRVIPLLGSVDSLRALIARHPNRIGLRQDPAFGNEMAVLLLTNTQWQRAREEEFRRAKQERREEAMRQAAAAQQKPRILADAPWFYSDPQNNIQGPFRGEEMRQWLEAGYFKGDLPISQQPTGPFVPLQALFPDLVVAFKARGSNVAAEAAAEEDKRAREAEGERIAVERAQAEANAAAEAVERERTERELTERVEQGQAEREHREREATDATGMKQSAESAQLKMMLGLGKSGGHNENEIQGPPVEETPLKKSGRSVQSEKVQLKPNKQRQQGATEKTPAGSQSQAWGGAASAAPRKSISEIQQEEARAAARLAMERKNIPRSSSGGWANIAASKGGSTGWSSGAVKTTPAVVLTNPNAANARHAAQPAGQPQSSAQRPRKSDSDKASDDFGASMPPALETWCKDQMKKLNASDDLTLVSFCMTLTDADEIRQYLTAYLGSTPQVNNFATEFINRKNGGKGKEEWESTSKGKKGKKKK